MVTHCRILETLSAGIGALPARLIVTRLAAIVAFAAAVAVSACDRVPLFAPTNSSITLNSTVRTLPLGGSTELTVFVMESAGTPVQNGTTVIFTSSLGRVDPAQAQTRNGIATTTFFAGDTSGTAEIRASSGGSGSGSVGGGTTTPPTTGGAATPSTNSSSNVVQIQVGAAGTAAVLVSASPNRVPSTGGTVTVIAQAVDAAGNALRGAPVSFSTTAGTLSASSVVSDSNGEARVQLTTNRTATVTARAAGQTATVEVSVATPASIALAVSPTNPTVNQPVTLTVTPTIAAGGVPPQVTVNWGDGTVDNLGTVSAARGVTHTYTTPGNFTISATATADGDTFTTSTAVLVNFATPVSVTVDPTQGNLTTNFSFTIIPTPGGQIRDVTIDFGDNSSRPLGPITNQTVVTHRYTTPNTYTAVVTQTLVDGTRTTAEATVIVTAQ